MLPTLKPRSVRLFCASAAGPLSSRNNNTSVIKMAPKNNKGKAKEPEKAGAAKVKGG
jgi:hypothetical protein